MAMGEYAPRDRSMPTCATTSHTRDRRPPTHLSHPHTHARVTVLLLGVIEWATRFTVALSAGRYIYPRRDHVVPATTTTRARVSG